MVFCCIVCYFENDEKVFLKNSHNVAINMKYALQLHTLQNKEKVCWTNFSRLKYLSSWFFLDTANQIFLLLTNFKTSWARNWPELVLGIWNGCRSAIVSPKDQECIATLCCKIAKVCGRKTVLSKNSGEPAPMDNIILARWL